MADMDEFLEMFFVECDELLDSLATGLRAMDGPDTEIETVHSVFRAVHSMKGAAAAFGLADLVKFAHRFETVLDLLRSGKVETTPALMAVLYRSSDFLTDLVTAARQSEAADQVRMEDLLGALDRLIGDDGESEDLGDDEAALAFVPISLDFGPLTLEVEQGSFVILFTPDAELYRSGNDPVALLHALQQLGETEVFVDTNMVSPLSDWRADDPHLSWKVTLQSSATYAQVCEVFEFVTDCCTLEITEHKPEPAALPELASAEAAEESFETQLPPSSSVESLASASEGVPTAGTRDDSAAKAQGQNANGNTQSASIRVSLERVDRLMNMIGELVIKEAMLYQVVETAGFAHDPDVVTALEGIRQLAGDIQESVMAIRAQPLKLAFQRMHRIVREAADATGKRVRLETLGENTEVDKTMIERLIDPLTHMIRNSIDHGLEDEVTRRSRGKPSEGKITLSAAHRSGRVLIEVSDDGGGIDRNRVMKIAEERGLIAPNASLSSGEIDSLLFLPGFSSKEEVSALSGRGVGLDVVRREIMSLGGRVTITSAKGKGTTFSITLPLTLAVLEGMLIQLADQSMVLPITAVQETLRPTSASIHGVGRSGKLLSNRGELIPIIDIGCVFGLREHPADLNDGVLIVVENDSHKRAALHVDGIFDQRQVVIKSLEENYGHVPGVSAATILGDGKIALIIDPEEIILSTGSEQHRNSAPLVVNG